MTVDSIAEHATGRAAGEAPQRVLEALDRANGGASPAAMAARLDPGLFAELALDVADWQYRNVPAFSQWWDAGPAHPAPHWEAVPALPIAAFKRMRVTSCSDREAAAATWHSSGTTSSVTSCHILPNLDLYEASLLGPALGMLVPEGAGPAELSVVQLAPDAATAPNSSLSHMLDTIRRNVDHPRPLISGSFEDAAGLHTDRAAHALRLAAAEGAPVLILTTSFALVHLLDVLRKDGMRLALADGSRLMDTGGYKGRSRSVSQQQLQAAVTELLGIPSGMCENEYGMSELSSQAWLGTIYRTVLGTSPDASLHPDIGHADGPRLRWRPPWMRTRVVDPATLRPVEDGAEGLLVHVDLANAYTCSFVRTEDWGRRVGDTYELLGRAPDAELRGCSLRLEDVIEWT